MIRPSSGPKSPTARSKSLVILGPSIASLAVSGHARARPGLREPDRVYDITLVQGWLPDRRTSADRLEPGTSNSTGCAGRGHRHRPLGPCAPIVGLTGRLRIRSL